MSLGARRLRVSWWPGAALALVAALAWGRLPLAPRNRLELTRARFAAQALDGGRIEVALQARSGAGGWSGRPTSSPTK